MTGYGAGQISRITGATIITGAGNHNLPVSRILTDSRTVLSGEAAIFFALTGNNHNGHHFIPELVRKGVRVFTISEDAPTGEAYRDIVFLKVGDTLKALHRLAGYHRRKFSYPVIGITGSNGKTIIKEWLNELLSDQYSIVKSPRSYNSQVGVPLSVWQMDNHHTLALFEAGISRPGEMMNLEEVIQPDAGIFTNIGDAHQENFATLEEKTDEKLLLFKRAKKLIFCSDHPMEERVSQFCREHNISAFGWSLSGKQAQVQFKAESFSGNTLLLSHQSTREYRFSIPFTDPSAIENACHCFTTILALGASAKRTIAGFSRLESLAMRLEIRRGINNCIVINDYYNSDINSVEIALNVLRHQSNKEQLTKIVFLSDLRQSGFPVDELYSRVNQLLNKSGVNTLIGVGPVISSKMKDFSQKGFFFQSTDEYIRNFNPAIFKNAAILIKGARDFRFERIGALIEEKVHQTVLEINLNALVDNLNVFRKMIRPETRVMVMVKAFSYGSGDVEVARLLQYQGVEYLAVAVADEGVQLRKAGISTKIVVMNPERQGFQNIIDYQLEPNIYSRQLFEDFNRVLSRNGISDFPVHIKIDTGMNRLGFKGAQQVTDIGRMIASQKNTKVKSVFSHLAASDDPAFDSFTMTQIELFTNHCRILEDETGYPFMRHILNSAGVERFAGYQFEMVRLGIGLYGATNAATKLRNISRLKTTISQIKEADAGETIGYNRSGRLSKPSLVAVIPVGYADGLDRRLGNHAGKVFVNDRFAPFTGNICMDMSMIDITGIDAKPGDEVEIFGDHISVSEVAAICGTITYEILTGISQRVKRTYIQE